MSIKGFQIGSGAVQKYDYESLDNIPESFVDVDSTLTQAGDAADAKKVGDEIADLKSALSHVGGLTEDAKAAFLACFEHVAWIDDDGQDYYDNLYDALYPSTELVSISAVYTQSGTVYTTDSLDSLKSDLVVTATLKNGSTQTLSDNEYTLSGTLVFGTNTITVSYSGKTTTFTVSATQAFTITNTLTNATNSNNATFVGRNESYTATITANSGFYLDDTGITVTMFGSDITSTVLLNGVINIASVTGDITITAKSTDALYPLKNGTFTFSIGSKVTVTNYNHVEVTRVNADDVNGAFINLSDIFENTTNILSRDNIDNKTKKFTIPANSTAVFEITAETMAGNPSFNAFGTGTSNIGMAITPVYSGDTKSATKTFDSATDLGCLFLACGQAGSYIFDVSFVVDGVKYV